MTATATKAELTAERERLAARLAEVDAQLARPVLPDGWVDASEPPDYPDDYALRLSDDSFAAGWYDQQAKAWRISPNGILLTGDDLPHIAGVIAYARHEDVLDSRCNWLTAQPAEAEAGRYPRYFTPFKRCCGDTAYIRIDGTDGGHHFDWSGNQRDVHAYESEAEQKVIDRKWREITAAEAEAMLTRVRHLSDCPLAQVNASHAEPLSDTVEAEVGVKPVVKDSLTAEATTAELLEWLDSLVDHGPATKKGEFVRARILAADHSVDLRGLWEKPGEKHKRSDTWLLHFADEAGVRHCTAAWWNCDMNAWCYACTVIAIIGDVIALADPAKLIGGGE